MKRMAAAVVGIACLFGSAVAYADDAVSVPRLTGHVTDTAQVLSAAERASLSKRLAEYERETHHPIAVLTIKTLGAESIAAVSLRVANASRLGLPGWNDGILVTLAVDEGQCRIELGRGMERYITNSAAKAIVEQQMKPEFAQRHFARGLRTGLQKLMELARAFQIADPSRPPTP